MKPWITTRRRKVTQKALRAALGKSWFLEPVFLQDNWREFYAWCRSYVTGNHEKFRAPAREVFPDECPICGNCGYVRGKRFDRLVVCPRWSVEYRSCVG